VDFHRSKCFFFKALAVTINNIMQSKKQSFIESFTNTLIGFVISLIATFIVLPLFGIKSTFAQNLGITICFTIISIVRGYVIRRYFNKKNYDTNQIRK
jgi:hypothetical protein